MVVIWKYWYNSCTNKILADGYITTHHLRCYHVEKESMPGYVLKEQENLLLRKNIEKDSTGSEICNTESEAQHTQRLAANQQQEADRRASESG